MRPAVIAVVALAVGAAARPAAAQHAHHGPPAAEAPRPWCIAVSAVAATVDGGDYEGVAPGVTWRRGGLALGVAATVYRLAQATARWGLGDTVVHGAARVWRRGAARVGASLAVGLPTGGDGLGMGHAMAMTGGSLTLDGGALRARLGLGGGVALDGGDPHAAHHAAPVVAPMNRRELGGDARLELAVSPAMTLHAAGAVAVPAGDGVVRAQAGGGARWAGPRWSTGAELAVGLAGDPFDVRAAVDVARMF